MYISLTRTSEKLKSEERSQLFPCTVVNLLTVPGVVEGLLRLTVDHQSIFFHPEPTDHLAVAELAVDQFFLKASALHCKFVFLA